MEIKSFAEVKPSVWKKMERPWIAVYQRGASGIHTGQQEPIFAKVYDGDTYTGIFMQAKELQEMIADIEKYSPLIFAEKGAADPEELIGAYV